MKADDRTCEFAELEAKALMSILPPNGNRGASAARNSAGDVPHCPGLYIVEPLCVLPVSVNANDPRMAERCLKVTRGHIKVGKARSLAWRERGYQNVFGAGLVRFRPLAHLVDPEPAERCVLGALVEWRQRSPAGRKTEWLLGIGADEAAAIVLHCLTANGFAFDWRWRRGAGPEIAL